jgi:F-type H+-transporting ATPase subunit b
VPLRFETAPEVVCGIELQTNGHKIAWNLEHYLRALEESLAAAFAAERPETRGTRGPAQASAAGHPQEGEDTHATGA